MMNVTLIGHTQLTKQAIKTADLSRRTLGTNGWEVSDGQVVALAAIRQCYSHKTAMEVLKTESEKYFGEKGKEGKRLFNQIVNSGHTSTLEHISFTFAVEGVSRALLAQLTRHRHLSFSVQSQRYVKLSSESRSGGFKYVVPEKVNDFEDACETFPIFCEMMEEIQKTYDKLISLGVPQEDARAILPQATETNLIVTGNLRSMLDFYSKRQPGKGGQKEITVLAEKFKEEILEVEPWVEPYFK